MIFQQLWKQKTSSPFHLCPERSRSYPFRQLQVRPARYRWHVARKHAHPHNIPSTPCYFLSKCQSYPWRHTPPVMEKEETVNQWWQREPVWSRLKRFPTCPSSSLRSEVLTSGPSPSSSSNMSSSHRMKYEPRNFCISTVTYMDTGMM